MNHLRPAAPAALLLALALTIPLAAPATADPPRDHPFVAAARDGDFQAVFTGLRPDHNSGQYLS